jgi:hypothetical protein
MSVVVALFIGLTVSAEEIIRDRKIRKRESFLNLSKGSYLWSKIIIMFVLSAIQTVTFVLVGNSVLGLKGMYSDYWLVLFTTSCFANMLGLNISSAFNSAVTIYILIPFLIIPQLLLAGVVVKFDKLNPILAKQGAVPMVGEAMASRWAYEALAVNQFKDNKFEKQFYKYDKSISVASYKKNFWKAKIQNKLSKIETGYKEGKTNKDFENDILLIRDEIAKEQKILKSIKCEVFSKINVQQFNADVITGVFNYLKLVNDKYIAIENKARKESDELTSKLKNQLDIVQLRDDYENENLSQLVKNATNLTGENCLEKDGRLIQINDPIFCDPTESNIGRAHFYAPRKKVFGAYYSTFWVNIIVIWLMSISLIVTLYFDVFKKVLDGFEALFSKFKKKK